MLAHRWSPCILLYTAVAPNHLWLLHLLLKCTQEGNTDSVRDQHSHLLDLSDAASDIDTSS